MSIKTSLFLSLMTLSGLFSQSASAQDIDISPEIKLETRAFFSGPQYEEQFETLQSSLILTGDLRLTSENRKTRLKLEPYLRLDSQDDKRSYFDVREATLSHRSGDWDLLAGAAQVFWGVAESRNVVDIINQFDTIEDFDQGEKLGQPLIRVSNRSELGTFEAYYLPFFRKQKTIGTKGRLRSNLDISDSAIYERKGEEWAGDYALRYSNRFGNFDVGLHGFHGTSRDPFYIPDDQGLNFSQFYQKRTQAGVDIQYTKGPWLLKFEAIHAEQGGDNFVSAVGGFEFSLFDIAGKGFDLGLIGEYLYDNRDTSLTPFTIFENDAFIGTRFTLNDTQDTTFLAGAFLDMDSNSLIAAAEFQRRIGAKMIFEVEARFLDKGKDPFASAFSDDSHVTLRLTRHF